jgi:leader peptidase (prepilin peptidase)/N-methyltransferase
LFVAGLMVATFIDFEHYIIPDEITLGGCVAGLALATLYPPLVGESVWYLGLLASLVGLLVGGLSVWAIVEIGKWMFGRKKVPLEPGTPIAIADRKLTVRDDVVKWDELFMRQSDRIRFRAAALVIGGKSYQDVEVTISETHVEVGGEKFELATTGPITATTDLLILPQEAMGFGDVKLMAAIGAFLGWKPALFTLMVSSLLGSVVGLALIVLRLREMRGRIPYGPYIAAAAVIWVFYGHDLVDWYVGLLIKD